MAFNSAYNPQVSRPSLRPTTALGPPQPRPCHCTLMYIWLFLVREGTS